MWLRLFLIAMLAVLLSCSDAEESSRTEELNTTQQQTEDASLSKEDMLKEVDTSTFEISDSVIRQKKQIFPQPGGRIVNILISGVEPSSSIQPSGYYAHHIVRFFIDSGIIEIVSISPLAMPKRSEKDPSATISSISGIGPIDHMIRMDIDQAVRILDLMGYEDSQAQFKRLKETPKTKAGIVQRSYDQGMFIRDVLLRGIRKTNDVLGDLAVRAALAIVDTDLTYDECSYILRSVQRSGFGDDPDRIWVRVMPKSGRFTVDT